MPRRKGAGRPRLPKNKLKKKSLQVSITEAEREVIERLADEDDISMSAWGREAVEEKLERATGRRSY